MTEFIAAKGAETEQQWRQFLAYLFAQDPATVGKAAAGVLIGLQVAQTTTASSSVTISTGCGLVQAAGADGVSPAVNPSQITLNVLTGGDIMGGLPRNDIIVFDATTGTVHNVKGTANASPTDPTVSSSQLPLARLRHLASATTIPTAQIDDLRAFTTLFGIPTIPTAGAWQTLTITPSSGWSATAGVEPEARLLPNGDVEIAGAVTAGVSISNNTVLTLPVGMRPSKTRFLPAHHTSGAGTSQTIQPFVTSSGQLIIDITYSGGSLTPSVGYPIAGVIPL